jgi:stage II sporulation protein D
VARESPSSWPAEALKAQAVAARTYAITTNKPGAHFDHYPDTRSQVYGGVAAETASTDAAIAATRGEVVIYDGKPVTTYFFSTSGGRTENVENSLGGEPKPWLKSVEDPYDKVSPRHRWGPYRYTLSRARKKLGRLVKGSLKRIDVTKRGESPRIVEAVVVGTGGTTRVSGATLRRAFGLYDTWAYFNVVGTKVEPDEDAASAAVRANASATHRRAVVRGSITGLERGTEVLVQRRTRAGTWITEARTRIGRRGRYRADVGRAGVYRVKAGAIVGPSVRLR